jgi:hypothetical protein
MLSAEVVCSHVDAGAIIKVPGELLSLRLFCVVAIQIAPVFPAPLRRAAAQAGSISLNCFCRDHAMKGEAKKPDRPKRPALTKNLLGRKKVEVSGGAHLKGQSVKVGGDVVGRDKLTAIDDIVEVSGSGNIVAGDDVVQVQPGAIHVGKGGQLRQTIVSLPCSAQIAVFVGVAALIVIALGQVLPVREAVADGGFESGQSGNRSGKWELTAGVHIVETDEEDTPDNGDWKASVPAGETMTQPEVKIPTARSEMTVWYRSQNRISRGTLQVRFDIDIVYKQGVAAELEWEQTKFPINHKKYGGRIVTLTIEYIAPVVRAGGLSRIAAQPAVNAIWVDNIQIDESEAETVAQVTATPSATSTSMAVPTLEPTATPRPTREQRSAPTEAPRATNTATRTAVAGLTVISPTQTATQTLSFTWRPGDFRESGVNESGIGIWAQDIFVDVKGGTPPYTILFDGSPQASTPFEVLGLFCIGQVGAITIRSSDGQSVEERITVQDPICPTRTPTATRTPSPTRTIIVTPTDTPMPTETPTPTDTLTLVSQASNDPFDSSQGTVVVSHDTIIDPINAFRTSGGFENGNTLMRNGGLNSVSFIEFDTASPVSIAGVRLFAGNDKALCCLRRAMNHFKLLADVDGDSNFETTVVDAAINPDYDAQPGNNAPGIGHLDLTLLTSGVITAQHWRLEITQGSDIQPFEGARLIELDALPGPN